MGQGFERELERVRKARAVFEASQDEVERLKQEYFVAVRTLHEAGMPLREIAAALGLSHQRVHQMVDEATGKKHAALRRKLGKAAKQGGVAVLLVALGATGLATALQEPEAVQDHRVSQSPSTPKPRDHRRPGHFGIPWEECARRIFVWHEANKGRDKRPRAVIVRAGCELEVGSQRNMRITIEDRA